MQKFCKRGTWDILKRGAGQAASGGALEDNV